MFTIENDFIRVIVNPAGAELSSLVFKSTGREYMWSGDAKYWGKQSPVLFPIVGTLKDNSYFLSGTYYQLGRHGFAREKLFSVTAQTTGSLTFELQEDETTLPVFPFQFNFAIIYAIEGSSLSVTYRVKNRGGELMYFSVGGHPAFKLPISDQLAYDDYHLSFNQIENVGRWPISSDGLIKKAATPLLNTTNQLPLSKSLFYNDAIVFKDLQSDEVQVKSEQHSAGFSFSFKGFPYLGIWAAKDADFICIEPWCGIADGVNSNQLLSEKEGIEQLPAGDSFERTWSVRVW